MNKRAGGGEGHNERMVGQRRRPAKGLQRESQSSSPDESSQKSAGQSPELRAYGTFISFKGVRHFV